MYRKERSLRNTVIATTVLVVIAVIGVIAIFTYSYKAVPAVIVVTSTSSEAVLATSTPAPAHTLIPVIFHRPATTTLTAKCVIGGCSNEICSDTQHVSSCIYKASNACYAMATCERQPTGECGWTQTPALAACIAAADADSSNAGPQ